LISPAIGGGTAEYVAATREHVFTGLKGTAMSDHAALVLDVPALPEGEGRKLFLNELVPERHD
jgi:hypothetical protein